MSEVVVENDEVSDITTSGGQVTNTLSWKILDTSGQPVSKQCAAKKTERAGFEPAVGIYTPTTV